jgi:hypothetical protein
MDFFFLSCRQEGEDLLTTGTGGVKCHLKISGNVAGTGFSARGRKTDR